MKFMFYISDEFYYNYYRYYKTRTAPKVDVRIVIAVTITVISVVQVKYKTPYWCRNHL